MDLIPIRYEGGPANGTAGGVPPNVHTIHYGNKPNTVIYRRTDQTDAKGRIIFRADSK